MSEFRGEVRWTEPEPNVMIKLAAQNCVRVRVRVWLCVYMHLCVCVRALHIFN